MPELNQKERYFERSRGWELCRMVIQNYAVELFIQGKDEPAQMLRNMLLGKTRPTLVIQEDSLGIKLPE